MTELICGGILKATPRKEREDSQVNVTQAHKHNKNIRENIVSRDKATGPLRGVRIVEFAGIGPGPYASMMLSDMGADIVTIARPGQWKNDPRNFVNRGRRPVELDLKKPEDIAKAMELIACADALIEGFRPQVMERLGLGPDEALKRNPRLVYGRMTGWGQEGPLAHGRRSRHQLHRDHRRAGLVPLA